MKMSSLLSALTVVTTNSDGEHLWGLQKSCDDYGIELLVHYNTMSLSYSDARNQAIRVQSGKISTEWLLWIDPDERLVIPNIDSFEQALRAVNTAYIVTTRSPHSYLDGIIRMSEGSFARLYRHDSSDIAQWTGLVHENITGWLHSRNIDTQVIQPSIMYLYHLGYLLEKDDIIKKVTQRIEMCMDSLRQFPDDPRMWILVGQHFGVTGEIKKQISCFVQATMCPSITEAMYKYVQSLIKLIYDRRTQI